MQDIALTHEEVAELRAMNLSFHKTKNQMRNQPSSYRGDRAGETPTDLRLTTGRDVGRRPLHSHHPHNKQQQQQQHHTNNNNNHRKNHGQEKTAQTNNGKRTR